MNCERNRRLLYLYRDGELTEGQTKKMERHLHNCDACRREKERIESAARKISVAGEAVPNPADPALLTRTIMEKIEDEAYGYASDFREPNRAADFLHHFLHRLTTPGIRWAAVGAVLLIVGAFMFQGTMLLHRITVLEEKMTRLSAYAVPDTGTTTGPGIELAAIMDKVEDIYDEMPEDKDWVSIDKGTLRKLMLFYLRRRGKEGKLLQHIKDEIPNLDSFDALIKILRGRISRDELKKILEYKDNILDIILKKLEKPKHWRTL